MKTVVRFLLVVGMVFAAILLTTSCDDDHKDDQKDIIGTWQLERYKVTVDAKPNATMSETELEAALANYIFFAVNSQVVFSNTNVTLTPIINGENQQVITTTYVINKGTLTINLPIDNPKTIQGSLDIKDDREFDFTLDSESYMNLLAAIGQTDAEFQKIVDQIASASVKYHFSRVK